MNFTISIEKDGKDKKKPAAIVLNGQQNGGPMKITAVVKDKENDKLEQDESVVSMINLITA